MCSDSIFTRIFYELLPDQVRGGLDRDLGRTSLCKFLSRQGRGEQALTTLTLTSAMNLSDLVFKVSKERTYDFVERSRQRSLLPKVYRCWTLIFVSSCGTDTLVPGRQMPSADGRRRSCLFWMGDVSPRGRSGFLSPRSRLIQWPPRKSRWAAARRAHCALHRAAGCARCLHDVARSPAVACGHPRATRIRQPRSPSGSRPARSPRVQLSSFWTPSLIDSSSNARPRSQFARQRAPFRASVAPSALDVKR